MQIFFIFLRPTSHMCFFIFLHLLPMCPVSSAHISCLKIHRQIQHTPVRVHRQWTLLLQHFTCFEHFTCFGLAHPPKNSTHRCGCIDNGRCSFKPKDGHSKQHTNTAHPNQVPTPFPKRPPISCPLSVVRGGISGSTTGILAQCNQTTKHQTRQTPHHSNSTPTKQQHHHVRSPKNTHHCQTVRCSFFGSSSTSRK